MNTKNRKKASAALPRNARCQPIVVTLPQPSREPSRRAPCVAWQRGWQSTPRRGILLLVVLSLLTLFLMIGMAFIVTANQYRRAQKSLAIADRESNAPVRQGEFLDEVINQLLRDTNNQNSALRGMMGLRARWLLSDGLPVPGATKPTVR